MMRISWDTRGGSEAAQAGGTTSEKRKIKPESYLHLLQHLLNTLLINTYMLANKLLERWKQEEQTPFSGWNFSHIREKYYEEYPPWYYISIGK